MTIPATPPSRHDTGCPKCGSLQVHPSRPRGLREWVRKTFTKEHPFRCHACQWRGWLEFVVVPLVALRHSRPDIAFPDRDEDAIPPRV